MVTWLGFATGAFFCLRCSFIEMVSFVHNSAIKMTQSSTFRECRVLRFFIIFSYLREFFFILRVVLRRKYRSEFKWHNACQGAWKFWNFIRNGFWIEFLRNVNKGEQIMLKFLCYLNKKFSFMNNLCGNVKEGGRSSGRTYKSRKSRKKLGI